MQGAGSEYGQRNSLFFQFTPFTEDENEETLQLRGAAGTVGTRLWASWLGRGPGCA